MKFLLKLLSFLYSIFKNDAVVMSKEQQLLNTIHPTLSSPQSSFDLSALNPSIYFKVKCSKLSDLEVGDQITYVTCHLVTKHGKSSRRIKGYRYSLRYGIVVGIKDITINNKYYGPVHKKQVDIKSHVGQTFSMKESTLFKVGVFRKYRDTETDHPNRSFPIFYHKYADTPKVFPKKVKE